jgi:hypothetical protein
MRKDRLATWQRRARAQPEDNADRADGVDRNERVCERGVSDGFGRIEPDGQQRNGCDKESGERNDSLDTQQVVGGAERTEPSVEECGSGQNWLAPRVSTSLARIT